MLEKSRISYPLRYANHFIYLNIFTVITQEDFKMSDSNILIPYVFLLALILACKYV